MRGAEGTLVAGRYRLLERIGAGGAGIVWRAVDELLERAVAVKLLRPELASDEAAVARFLAEASAAAKLTHPNVVVVFDVGRDTGRDLLVMELVEGPTLGDLLEDAPLPPELVAPLGHGVAAALGAAHARGLVHRDVKPANVLLAADGRPKVADFGIARALGDASARLTVPGMVMGTARYLAPEQLRDEDVDGRSDVYALGLLLSQALTGRAPFGDGTAAEIAARRLTTQLPPPSTLVPGVPMLLDEVVERATRIDPDERYADGAEMAAALAPAVGRDAAAALQAAVARTPSRHAGADLPVRPPRQHARARSPEHARARSPEHARAPSQGDARRRDDVEATTVRPRASAAPRRTLPTRDEIDRTTALPRPSSSRQGAPASAAAPARGASAAPRASAATTSTRTTPSPRTTPPPRSRSPRGRRTSDHEARARRRRRRLLVTLLVTASLVAVAWVAVTGRTGEVLDRVTGSPDPVVLPIVDGGDHDPLGDGWEHPDRVPAAFDGDPTTAWTSERYDRADLIPPAKDGVGMWVTIEEAARVTSVELVPGVAGAQVEVYVGDQPPAPDAAPADLGELVASGTVGAPSWHVELDPGAQGRVVLLWFTELAPVEGGFRASVAELELRGHPEGR